MQKKGSKSSAAYMASVAGWCVMDVGQSPELGERPQAGLASPGRRIHSGGERGLARSSRGCRFRDLISKKLSTSFMLCH